MEVGLICVICNFVKSARVEVGLICVICNFDECTGGGGNYMHYV